jgi:hypothetical protein
LDATLLEIFLKENFKKSLIMAFRHKLEFKSLQSRLGLSAVAVFLMLAVLKMKKKKIILHFLRLCAKFAQFFKAMN